MRVFVAERGELIWAAATHDDWHPKSSDEFEWRLGHGEWVRREGAGCCGALDEAVRQIREYFAGRRMEFTVPLRLEGTAFQKRVWEELTRIPFAQTRSYRDIAESVCCPNGQRAVGGANGKNRLPLFVPCHRVIASGGKLGGFTGGLGLKIRLLNHEDGVRGLTKQWRLDDFEASPLRTA